VSTDCVRSGTGLSNSNSKIVFDEIETVSPVLTIDTIPSIIIKNKKNSVINEAIVPRNDAKKNLKNCFMIIPL